jgi:hypothetical protein
METAANSSADRKAIAGLPRNLRAQITNRPQQVSIDGRSALGRRIRDLADSFAAALNGWGNLSDLQAAAVRRAAELGAFAELMRQRALNGDTSICADDLVRVDRLAGQAARALRLDERRAPPPEPSLREYLARNYANAACRSEP